MIRVGLLSPSLAVRVGLRALLEDDDQITVVTEAGNLDELMGLSLPMDVLIMSGLGLANRGENTFPIDERLDVAILILGEASADMRLLPDFEKPAWGVLAEEASQDELLAAVHALSQGLIVGDPSLLDLILGKQMLIDESRLDTPIEPLTDRELEVLQLLAQGLANKQIAGRLDISTHTVKFHISSIYGKLGATNRTEAVRIGLQAGLILL